MAASTSLQEKRKTSDNSKSEILTARVIANFGDAGLLEDVNFDILSKFIIVAIESIDRVPTTDKWATMFAVVKRPETLWIKAVGGQANNPVDQQRSDYYGNTNTGLVANYSVSTIGQINNPYQLGETIRIKKLPKPLIINNTQQDLFFQSVFNTFTNMSYGPWYNAGNVLPYIQNNNAVGALMLKTIALTANGYYTPILNKYQYEAFSLLQNINDTTKTQALIQLFNGQWQGTMQVYNANGGYIFNKQSILNIPTCEYEDINDGNKTRISSNECIPTIVAVPNSFPVPKQRTTQTFTYSPLIVQGG